MSLLLLFRAKLTPPSEVEQRHGGWEKKKKSTKKRLIKDIDKKLQNIDNEILSAQQKEKIQASLKNLVIQELENLSDEEGQAILMILMMDEND